MTALERGKKKTREQYVNAPDDLKRLLDKIERHGNPRGIYCQKINEPVPSFERAPCEKVISGHNNSFIVLGRDRPASLASGYGGSGMTQCGMIDLVVGRHASYKNEKGEIGPPGDDKTVGPNFFSDAARIYISQKCNIDEYFGLAAGSEPTHFLSDRSTSMARSGIGIKADHVRIIGRNHIKIVTGRAVAEGAGLGGEKNSAGGNTEFTGGIDFIAGNYTEDEYEGLLGGLRARAGIPPLNEGKIIPKLQPLVKGDNLIECLRHIDRILGALSALILANAKSVAQVASISSTIASLSLPPLPPAAIASIFPALRALQSIGATVAGQINSMSLETNFLNSTGQRYICSRHVRTV